MEKLTESVQKNEKCLWQRPNCEQLNLDKTLGGDNSGQNEGGDYHS